MLRENNFYLPDFDQFWNGGFFEVLKPTHEQILMEDFVKKPKQFPLSNRSKKIEIFSDEVIVLTTLIAQVILNG